MRTAIAVMQREFHITHGAGISTQGLLTARSRDVRHDACLPSRKE